MNDLVLHSPVGRALDFWRRNEHTIVILLMVGAGLSAVALVAIAVKAAPVALKLAAASQHGAAVQAALAKYGVTAAAAV